MKKTLILSCIALLGLSLGLNNVTTVHAANSVETTSKTTDDQTQNSQTTEKAPAGAPVFARDSSKGPGYYKINTASAFSAESLMLGETSQQNFLSGIKAGAIEGWKDYKILPSITAAQAIIESGWGSSVSGTNNIFGIKGTPGTLCWTREVNSSGQSYEIQAYFKNFSSLSECIEFHNSLLGTSSYYRGMAGQKDYRTAAQYPKSYATDPNYVQTVINIIEEYGLSSWDQEAFNQTDFPKNAIDSTVITIQYAKSAGAFAFDENGNAISGSNSTFVNGSKWKTAGTKVIANQEMFKVATHEYVPLKDTTIGADGTVTINYSQGYGVSGYHLNGSPVAGSNGVLKTGTSWATSGAAYINGQIMYKIATDEYVPKEFTQYGNGR